MSKVRTTVGGGVFRPSPMQISVGGMVKCYKYALAQST